MLDLDFDVRRSLDRAILMLFPFLPEYQAIYILDLEVRGLVAHDFKVVAGPHSELSDTDVPVPPPDFPAAICADSGGNRVLKPGAPLHPFRGFDVNDPGGSLLVPKLKPRQVRRDAEQRTNLRGRHVRSAQLQPVIPVRGNDALPFVPRHRRASL